MGSARLPAGSFADNRSSVLQKYVGYMDGDRETIFALSSGAPPAGIAIVRISGARVRFAIETFCGSLPPARKAVLRSIRSNRSEDIDTGLVLFFPAPHSFTGEDCGEFHIHGGRSVISALLAELGRLPGFRPAEAGEFTRRAFENGRLDLTAVEGLSDLVAAETEMQRRLALEHARGKLASLYDEWARTLTRCRALVEAGIDFADEGDVPDDVAEDIRAELGLLRIALAAHLEDAKAGAIIRDGFRVAIAGPPNAGKSSLMNALARRDVSIVSPEPGTTRDILTVTLDLGGYAVILQDLAGLRETAGAVEQEGIRRAMGAIAEADLVLLLGDHEEPPAAGLLDMNVAIVRVGTKSDLVAPEMLSWADISISTVTGAGLPELVDLLKRRVAAATARSANTIPARLRQRGCLAQALDHLDRAVRDDRLPAELLAEELRAAAQSLGRITGRVDVEDLLDVIFASFCIGK